jgi:hypothetical protein
MKKTRSQRFQEKTKPGDGDCVIWTGAVIQNSGYGQFRDGNRRFLAHRWAYEQKHGEIPRGMLVCHTCDTRLCVNENHLFLGTYKDNYDDMIRKGRQGVCGLVVWGAHKE